jgi:ubiquinone/menaquinone biosynthesis C-methylase UbiE
MSADRDRTRAIAREFTQRGDPMGWFERLYVTADGDPRNIPWADMTPNPGLVEWLDRKALAGSGRKALVVGCGLGDDAEELSRRRFQVVAFDISPSAIDWSRKRFPHSSVEYCVADVFEPAPSWEAAFDFVFEAYTLQTLPIDLRPTAIARISRFVGRGGVLLLLSRGRKPEEDPGAMPWPLTRDELSPFQRAGLTEASFEEYWDGEDPRVRRFRVELRRPVHCQP